MPAEFPVVIIGAGPAGLSAAHYLAKHDKPVLILEQSKNGIGGLSQTVTYKGNMYDIGPHRFFSKSDEINALWFEILGAEDFRTVKRLTRILYRKKFFGYPLQPAEAMKNLGFATSSKVILSYLASRVKPKRPEDNFEDWITNRFGSVLFHIFFKTYTEKVWGMDTRDISSDWASQRIQGMSLFAAAYHALVPQNNKNKPKTLVDAFYYPKLGPGQMWQKALDYVTSHYGTIQEDSQVTKIRHNNGRIYSVEVKAGETTQNITVGNAILSSMPMRALVNAFSPAAPAKVLAAADGLKYRDFVQVFLIIESTDLFPDNWLYIHDTGVKVGRITNYANFSKEMISAPDRTSTLGLEYFCFEHDTVWNMSDADLISLAVTELKQLGLIVDETVADGTVFRMQKAYPVYDEHYRHNVKAIRDWLEKTAKNLTLIGRNGMHKYNNQDHSMLTGLMAAKNILEHGAFDVWKVRTDTTYDETEDQKGDHSARAIPLKRR
jgi:protoporphyrinogen oxidase